MLSAAACQAAAQPSAAVSPAPTRIATPLLSEPIAPQSTAVLSPTVNFNDLERQPPPSIAATLGAVCPQIRPAEIDPLSPNSQIDGPAMVFPSDMAAWQDFFYQTGPRAESYPLDHVGDVGIELFSGAQVVVPAAMVVHNRYTAKGYDYNWIPGGKIYRFSSDDEMFLYAACVRHRSGP